MKNDLIGSYTNEEINQVCARLNKTLKRFVKLKKIDLSFNYLRSRLFAIFRGLNQQLEYLNLQDCRLDSSDIAMLNTQAMLKCLRSCKELNLSMNDLSQSYTIVFSIIKSCTQLICLSISYSQIPIDAICQNLATTSNLNAELTKLKVLFIQTFTPPKMHEIIDILHSFSSLSSLQKICFLPSLYAFPGVNDSERELSAMKILRVCSSILESQGRSDIELFDQRDK